MQQIFIEMNKIQTIIWLAFDKCMLFISMYELNQHYTLKMCM